MIVCISCLLKTIVNFFFPKLRSLAACNGRKARDTIITVPPGTVISVIANGPEGERAYRQELQRRLNPGTQDKGKRRRRPQPIVLEGEDPAEVFAAARMRVDRVGVEKSVGDVVEEVVEDERLVKIGDLAADGDRCIVAMGGRGGRGNLSFATRFNPCGSALIFSGEGGKGG